MIQEKQARFCPLSSLGMDSRCLGILSACTLLWYFQRDDRHSCDAVGASGDRKHPDSCSAVGTKIPSQAGGASLFLPVSPCSPCILLIDQNWLCLPRSVSMHCLRLGPVTAHPHSSGQLQAERELLCASKERAGYSVLPTVLGSAPVLMEKIIKAQDNHNPALEKQLFSPLSHINYHS